MSNSVQPHRQQPTRLPLPRDSLSKNTGVGCHFLLQCMKVKVKSCLTLSDPMDCSPPGSSIHGILQARVLEWGATAFSYIVTAAAKLLQSCLTLCDPRDGSPPGSAIPGILQARTLEWVAISFSISSFTAVISCCFAFTREQGSLIIMFLKCLFFITVDTSLCLPCSLFHSRTLPYVQPRLYHIMFSAALSFALSLMMVPLWDTTSS